MPKTEPGRDDDNPGYAMSIAFAMLHGLVLTIAVELLMAAMIHDVMGFEYVIIFFSTPFVLIWSLALSVLAAAVAGPILRLRHWSVYGIVFAAVILAGAIPAVNFTGEDFDFPLFALVAALSLASGTLIARFVPRTVRPVRAMRRATPTRQGGALEK